MSDERFDLSFAGELLAGGDPETARKHLAATFKLDASGIEHLFSGRAVIVKRAADGATAGRYRDVFEHAGARLRVTPIAPQDTAVARTDDQADLATGPERRDSDPAPLALGSDAGFLEEPRKVNIDSFDTGALSLVSGQDWSLADCESPPTPRPIPDIGHLTLAEMEPRPGPKDLAD